MIGTTERCARDNCDKSFDKVTHNQKYCSNECCRLETNRKIMEKYHERAAIKRGKKRVCSNCNTVLSRYNQDKVCGACSVSKRLEQDTETKELLGSVNWL